LVAAEAYAAACLLRFDFLIPSEEWDTLKAAFLVILLVKAPVFCLLRLDLDRWPRYAAFTDLVRLIRINSIASIATSAAIYMTVGPHFPRSVYVVDFLVYVVTAGGVRFAVRLLDEVRYQRRAADENAVLVYGAGVAGLQLVREIRSNPDLGYCVAGFLDDDPRKTGALLLGLPVLGRGEDAPRVLADQRRRGVEVKEIVVSMPSAAGHQIREAVAKGRAAGVQCRIVPGLGELISGKLKVKDRREISVTDLLGREPVSLDLASLRRAIVGKVVLVTGAAGSIGSEVCKQLAQLEPAELIALDQAESPLFALEADLRALYPALALSAEVGDIRDARRMEDLITDRGVNSIFHAAAYKHVPVMERQVCEAVRNNVVGTWNLAQIAWRCNVSGFLMISTDKAVNPSSIMGLTKRVAELIVTAARPPVGRGTPTKFVCVRFGNVLVSNGSVVPIFEKQIAAGGPVTVTHPDMRRYFMTVQEAVCLVLEAYAIGNGSEIFMLDMGDPVNIAGLARRLIMLHGLVPDEDIEIRFVGPRPGEKLFEELSLGAESLLPTGLEKIRVYQGPTASFSDLVRWMAQLQNLLWRRDPDKVLAHLQLLVPEYAPIPHHRVADRQRLSARAYAGGAS
jgi:FlaA1/EpsC-like NDP-sugar epimerase